MARVDRAARVAKGPRGATIAISRGKWVSFSPDHARPCPAATISKMPLKPPAPPRLKNEARLRGDIDCRPSLALRHPSLPDYPRHLNLPKRAKGAGNDTQQSWRSTDDPTRSTKDVRRATPRRGGFR